MATLTTRARNLRLNSTEAEKTLWRLLRSRQLAAAKFRRQQPIGSYIPDFVSFSHRLVVECDGGQHADDPNDEKRDEWFAGEGFRVLRFWNNDVLSNPEGVLTRVLEALSDD
jgi:very-short-patch-repair endonuclease